MSPRRSNRSAGLPCRAGRPEPPDHRLRAVAVPVDGWIQPYARLFDVTTPAAATVSGTATAATSILPLPRPARVPPGAVARLHSGAGADSRHVCRRPVLHVLGRDGVARIQGRIPAAGSTATAPTSSTIGALDDAAVWVTGRTQRGSLFFYLAVILTVAFVLPLTALPLAGRPAPEGHLLHRSQLAAAAHGRCRDHHWGAGRGPGQQALPGRADGLRHRLRHRADVRAAGSAGPGADADAGGDHHPGGLRAGHAQPSSRAAGPHRRQLPGGPACIIGLAFGVTMVFVAI